MTRVFGRAQNKGGMNEKQPDLASFAGVLATQAGAWVGARVRVFPLLYYFAVQSRLLAKYCGLTNNRKDVSRRRLKVEVTKGMRPCAVFRAEARKAS